MTAYIRCYFVSQVEETSKERAVLNTKSRQDKTPRWCRVKRDSDVDIALATASTVAATVAAAAAAVTRAPFTPVTSICAAPTHSKSCKGALAVVIKNSSCSSLFEWTRASFVGSLSMQTGFLTLIPLERERNTESRRRLRLP